MEDRDAAPRTACLRLGDGLELPGEVTWRAGDAGRGLVGPLPPLSLGAHEPGGGTEDWEDRQGPRLVGTCLASGGQRVLLKAKAGGQEDRAHHPNTHAAGHQHLLASPTATSGPLHGGSAHRGP